MGLHSKTEPELRAERFKDCYNPPKTRLKLTEAEIATAIGIQRLALLRKRKDPGKFTVKQIAALGDLLGWTDADYMAIIHPKK